MWKFLLVAFLTRVICGPLQDGNPATNWYNLFQTGGEIRRGPPKSSSDQVGSPVGANQPVPFGVSNVGTNFYQNFLVNGVVPSGTILGSTPSPVPSKAPIREDYTYTPGAGAHKLHKNPLTWNEARKLCNSENGHLAIINSVAEAQVLVKMLNNSGLSSSVYDLVNAHLGIHDLYMEGEWVTIFGESLANTGYEKWSTMGGNQPNNVNNRQHCGSLQVDAGLNDVVCTDVLPYFCEQTSV